jgi:hypothetical protein
VPNESLEVRQPLSETEAAIIKTLFKKIVSCFSIKMLSLFLRTAIAV